MLPAKNRLKNRSEFSFVGKNGKYFSIGNISIKFAIINSEETRIGFPVGKKYSSIASKRNRARRVLREATKRNIGFLKNGVLIIVMPNVNEKSFEKASLDEITKDMLMAFQKSNLIKK